LEARIKAAIADIMDDADDMAALHNVVAQGQVEFDIDSDDFVVVTEEDCPAIVEIAKSYPPSEQKS
jgi:hypothetical protein